MKQALRRLAGDDDGQDLIEYGLLAAVISVASIASIKAVAVAILPWMGMVITAFRSL